MKSVKAIALRLLPLHPKDRRWVLKRLPENVAESVKQTLAELEANLGSEVIEVTEELRQLSQSMMQARLAKEQPEIQKRSTLAEVKSKIFVQELKQALPVRVQEYLYVREGWSWIKPKKSTKRPVVELKRRVHQELIEQMAAYHDAGSWQSASRESTHG